MPTVGTSFVMCATFPLFWEGWYFTSLLGLIWYSPVNANATGLYNTV